MKCVPGSLHTLSFSNPRSNPASCFLYLLGKRVPVYYGVCLLIACVSQQQARLCWANQWPNLKRSRFLPLRAHWSWRAPRGGVCISAWDPGAQRGICQEHNLPCVTGQRDHCGGHIGAKSFPLEMIYVTCIYFICQINSYGQVWHQWDKEI